MVGLADAGLLRMSSGESISDFDGLYSPSTLDEEFVNMSTHDEAGEDRCEHNSGTSSIPTLIREHIGPQSIAELEITEREFPYHIRADLQRALDNIMCDGVEPKYVGGIRKRYSDPMDGLGFSSLIHYEDENTAVPVPLEYEELDVGDADPVRCLKNALWLIIKGGSPLCVLMTPHMVYQQVSGLRIQVAAPRTRHCAEQASALLQELEKAVRKSQSYRGKILSWSR